MVSGPQHISVSHARFKFSLGQSCYFKAISSSPKLSFHLFTPPLFLHPYLPVKTELCEYKKQTHGKYNNNNSVNAASESNTPVKPFRRDSAMCSQCPLAHKTTRIYACFSFNGMDCSLCHPSKDLQVKCRRRETADICFSFFVLAFIFIFFKTGSICCLLSSLQTMAAF